MSLPEQTKQRKRNVHKRRNAYHAPANMVEMQRTIADVTLNHLREGKAVGWQNLAITYPLAFNLVYNEMSQIEKIEQGLICNEDALRHQLLARVENRKKDLVGAFSHA